MNRILIAKDLPIAQNLEIDQLQAGQIGIFGMGGGDFTMKPVGKLTEVDFLQVYVGGNPLPSDIIDTRNPRRMHWVKTPFHAPVKNVWRFSTSHVPKSMYDTWSIKVKIADRASNQWTLEFSVSKACTTLKELYCEIEKKIDKSPYLSAVADEGGVVIVPNDINHTIQVGASFEPDMRCQSASCVPICYDVKEIVEANYGAGSKAHVRDIEFKYRPSLGNHLLEFGHEIPFPQILTDTNGVEEYDLYTGVYGNQNHAGGDQGREVFEMTHTLILAIPKNSQAGTGFQQLMEAQLQRLGIKFAVSPVI
jgi:hypothetical protein